MTCETTTKTRSVNSLAEFNNSFNHILTRAIIESENEVRDIYQKELKN
jgi:hypothetical protein